MQLPAFAWHHLTLVFDGFDAIWYRGGEFAARTNSKAAQVHRLAYTAVAPIAIEFGGRGQQQQQQQPQHQEQKNFVFGPSFRLADIRLFSGVLTPSQVRDVFKSTNKLCVCIKTVRA